jgi:hypothetical protein
MPEEENIQQPPAQQVAAPSQPPPVKPNTEATRDTLSASKPNDTGSNSRQSSNQ